MRKRKANGISPDRGSRSGISFLFSSISYIPYSIFFNFLIVPASAVDSSASCFAVSRSSSRLTVDAGGFAEGVPRSSLSPSSQSADTACTRQMFASISAPGATMPFSYRAHCWYFMFNAIAISDCDVVPRSSFNLSDKTLMFYSPSFLLKLFCFTPLTYPTDLLYNALVPRNRRKSYHNRRPNGNSKEQ